MDTTREFKMSKQIFLTILLASQLATAAIEVKSTAVNGKVLFEATGRPSMIKIKGEGEGAVSNLQLNQNKISGEIFFKLESLKTGIGLRDEHLKEKYLQVKTNPVARLTIKELVLPAAWSLQNATVVETAFHAILNLHGVEKEITGVYNIESGQLKSSAQFEIKLSDFNIDIPVYLGVKVADVVKINVFFDKMNLSKKN